MNDSLSPQPLPPKPISPEPLTRVRWLSYGRLRRLTLKELREILRDRRTVVTLLLMPLLVYPLLSLIFNRFLLSIDTNKATPAVVIGVQSVDAARELARIVVEGDRQLQALRAAAAQSSPESSQEKKKTGEIKVEWKEVADLRTAVADAAVDLGVLVRTTRDPAAGSLPTYRFELIRRRESLASTRALRYIEERLRAVNDGYVRNLFLQRGSPMQFPVKLRYDHVSATGGGAVSLTTVIPLILILMTITGAVYPAIDLTAGERERKTMETLIAAPVPRLGLLLAKYFAVLAVALLTGTVNLIAMTATVFASGLAPTLLGEGNSSLYVLLQVFLLLLVFTAFFSAVLLSFTSMARSFKEAQAYIVPLMLLALAPGVLGVMPALKFNALLAVTPLVNIVLLSRDMLQGVATPSLAVAAILSTSVYTLAAIAVASRVFGGDAVLYGSQESWKDIFRRPTTASSAPRVSTSLMCLALIFPMFYGLSSLLAHQEQLSPSLRTILSAAATSLLFGVIPLLAAVAQRVRVASGFSLRAAAVEGYVGAALLGVAAWPFAHEIVVLAQAVGIGGISEERIAGAKATIEQLQQMSPFLLLAAYAAAPAIFEELFFRGFLFSALEQRLAPLQTVAVSAGLFGAFHLVSGNVLAVERFLPSAFMGLLLGFVRLRTGSVLPSILLHALHNGLLWLIVIYRDELAARGWGVAERMHLPGSWLASAAGIGVAGAVLVLIGSRRTTGNDKAADARYDGADEAEAGGEA